MTGKIIAITFSKRQFKIIEEHATQKHMRVESYIKFLVCRKLEIENPKK